MDEEDKPTEPDAPQTDPPAAVQWMMQQAAAGQSTALLPPIGMNGSPRGEWRFRRMRRWPLAAGASTTHCEATTV